MIPTHLDDEDDDLAAATAASDRRDDARVDASMRRHGPTEIRTRVDLSAWSIFVSVGASLLSAGLAVALSLSVSARNVQRGVAAREELQRTQCAIIIALDENYRQAPPPNETGKLQARSMSQLRTALGCPPHVEK